MQNRQTNILKHSKKLLFLDLSYCFQTKSNGSVHCFLKNDPYSSFGLKARLWGQSHKDLKYFCVITDMTVVTER